MIDSLRHAKVFNPDKFTSRVDVIGVGATGSRIAVSLAKLGVTDIHIWDDDVIAEHNIANQVFGNPDIGKKKVVALKDLISLQTGTEVTVHDCKADGKSVFGDYVFLLTDTMASRKEIFTGAIKLKLSIRFMFETRMGADTGRIYTVCPIRPSHVRRWEETLCSDDDAEESLCGARTSVGPTAEVISGFAVWQFIRAVANDPKDVPEGEVIFGLRPFAILSAAF